MSKKISSRQTHLPAANPNEDLETISQAKLTLLLNPELFEIRRQILRDKGVDLIVEVKEDSHYTNFHFAIQLKASNSIIPNRNGTFSCPVETQNIHYLRNFGMPAYYILYDGQNETFYLENIMDVYRALLLKYNNKKPPKEFTIRFSQRLDSSNILGIHQEVMKMGMLIKRINAHVDARVKPTTDMALVIDENLEVYNVEQNIAYIEVFGFILLNQQAVKRIIDIEQRTHPRQNASPTFNLVCGVAYYRHSNLYKALEFLKLAQPYAHEFDTDTRSILAYTLLTVKYLLGILPKKEYDSAQEQIMRQEKVSQFLRLENAYHLLTAPEGKNRDKLEVFYTTTKSIIDENPDNRNLLFAAYGQMLEAEGVLLVFDLANNFFLYCGRVHEPLQTQTYFIWSLKAMEYHSRILRLEGFALKEKHFFAITNLSLFDIRWLHQKDVIDHVLSHWESQTLNAAPPTPQLIQKTLDRLNQLQTVQKAFNLLHNKENVISCLRVQFELQQFAGLAKEAEQTAKDILTLIDAHELNALRPSIDSLLAGNTIQQRFINELRMRIQQTTQVAVATGMATVMPSDISDDLQELMAQDDEWTINHFPELRLPA